MPFEVGYLLKGAFILSLEMVDYHSHDTDIFVQKAHLFIETLHHKHAKLLLHEHLVRIQRLN